MTARTCTFCSFVVLWHWKTNFSHTLEKLGHFALDFRSNSVEKMWIWTEFAEIHRELSKSSDTIFYEAQQHTWTSYSPNMKCVRSIARFLQPGQISKPLFSCGCTGSATGTEENRYSSENVLFDRQYHFFDTGHGTCFDECVGRRWQSWLVVTRLRILGC